MKWIMCTSFLSQKFRFCPPQAHVNLVVPRQNGCKQQTSYLAEISLWTNVILPLNITFKIVAWGLFSESVFFKVDLTWNRFQLKSTFGFWKKIRTRIDNFCYQKMFLKSIIWLLIAYFSYFCVGKPQQFGQYSGKLIFRMHTPNMYVILKWTKDEKMRK